MIRGESRDIVSDDDTFKAIAVYLPRVEWETITTPSD